MNNFGIIIEARTGSKRLPNKILKRVNKKTILDYLVKRVKTQKKIKKIIISTTTLKKDIPLVKIAKKNKIGFFQGSENDLIKRVIDTATVNKLKYIVQVTSDNPFFDIEIFEILLKKFKQKKYDFVSNSLKSFFPIGSDIRIFSLKNLKTTSKYVKGKARQHTCYYFLKNLKKIKSYTLKAGSDYHRPDYRLTLDYKSDLKLIKKIIYNFGNNYCSLKNIIKFLDNNKEISDINSNLPNKLTIPKYR
jgi:spore coat polysaccharide biosynthesis protein SpsF (cytidylyltransferase family)